ncbi:HAD family hydrolase [Ruminococcus sp.]|uniref:HAD-IIIC family phosphatase n=1 Tax=Ruminococcus sp. TaxID=41978 RepID=UPI0025DC8F8F|nr:HAD-IIIC family phosphatase [Ruminococcus sp.]
MIELNYPFDNGFIMKKKRSLKRQLLGDGAVRVKKKIAVLGGSTTDDIVSVLELFLLDMGFECKFYQSEYGQFWQDAVFSNEELDSFAPDLVYIHTSLRNLSFLPTPRSTEQEIEQALNAELDKLSQAWDGVKEHFNCPVIQNNFELPSYRLMGNMDASDRRGAVNFVTRLNVKLYDRIAERKEIYLNDINWLSAAYGLEKWSDPKFWYLYKYALDINAIPELAFQIANIIKAIFGKNKKALALDLDNTLWGGIVGDDGAENLEIGKETAEAMAYYEFQKYVKAHKDIGVLLTVCSKNEEENAIAGLSHPEGVLRPADFVNIKANWLPKDKNIADIAQELNILAESIVFVDDNPAEREIVREQLAGTAVPEIGEVTDYVRVLDRSGFFETVSLSEDDFKRNEMYRANAERAKAQSRFENYEDYLLSLEMRGKIADFSPMYIQRITQLTNKSNQFNLTTKRYTVEQMETVYDSDEYVRLYGKLYDKFGDNGVVAVTIGKLREVKEGAKALDIELWLMSCRVLKRDMELAMLDRLVEEAKKRGVSEIFGYYYPTAKNKMVAGLYESFGFEKVSENEDGSTVWKLCTEGYVNKNKVIEIVTD